MTEEGPKPSKPRTRRWFLLAVVLVAVLFAVLVRPRPSPRGALPAEISVTEAVAMREQGSFLLDVRQPDEWAEAHVPGSTLIPLDQLEGRLAEVPRDQEVVVLCRSGNRSKRGRDILTEAGYAQVTSVAGGLTAWKAQGQPTVAGP